MLCEIVHLVYGYFQNANGGISRIVELDVDPAIGIRNVPDLEGEATRKRTRSDYQRQDREESPPEVGHSRRSIAPAEISSDLSDGSPLMEGLLQETFLITVASGKLVRISLIKLLLSFSADVPGGLPRPMRQPPAILEEFKHIPLTDSALLWLRPGVFFASPLSRGEGTRVRK